MTCLVVIRIQSRPWAPKERVCPTPHGPPISTHKHSKRERQSPKVVLYDVLYLRPCDTMKHGHVLPFFHVHGGLKPSPPRPLNTPSKQMAQKVRSKQDNKIGHTFYISGFMEIVQYIHYANNSNTYVCVFTDETEQDIQRIDTQLKQFAKHPRFDRIHLLFRTNTTEQAKWCTAHSFRNAPLTQDIRNRMNAPVDCSTTKPMECYTYDNRVSLFEYFRSPNLQIVRMENLEHNRPILKYLTPLTYVFVMIGYDMKKHNFDLASKVLHFENPSFPKQNIVYESPDLDLMLWSNEYGFQSIFCNHNCWLDHTLFTIKEEPKLYNMVMNCRPERTFKRPYLAKHVTPLAYIQGKLYNQHDKFDVSELSCAFLNTTRISPQHVQQIYNQSHCGGIFSKSEGACYTSSEYLLCGLPVVSTHSSGGRDTWYTTSNSILVEPDEEDVREGVQRCIKHVQSNRFNRENIRNAHIQLSETMRSNFHAYVQRLFDTYGVARNAQEYFQTNYFHKFKKSCTFEEAIGILQSNQKE